MNNVELICSAKCNNLSELLDTLRRFSDNALHQIDNRDITINDGAVSVRVERQVLTDRSEAYNITIEP